MRPLAQYALFSLIALSLTACSPKPAPQPEPQSDPVTADAKPDAADAQITAPADTPKTAPERPEAVQERPTDEQITPPPTTIADDALTALVALLPEQMERELLTVFDTAPTEDQTLKTLRERSEIGDDRAKEAFVKNVFSRPRTDPNYNTAIKYLTTIREYKDPDIMYQRAVYEYARRVTDPEAAAKAMLFFKMAAELGHEPTLKFLIQNPALGMTDIALKKITDIYKTKPQTPENLFDLAKFLEMGPPSFMPQVESLIKSASDAGYAKAMFVHSGQLMDREDTWFEGVELLKKAAAAGSEDANLRLALLYIPIVFSESYKDASEFSSIPMTEMQYNTLKKITDQAEDNKLFVVNILEKASGLEEACGILLGFTAGDEQTPSRLEASNAVIPCIRDFIAAMPTRDACDHAYDQITYATESEITEADLSRFFTVSQRTKLGELMLGCYKTALEHGDDYPVERPYIGYSTAFQLAVLYAGNTFLNLKTQPAERLRYLVYAAHHNDLTAQTMLALNYEHGGDIQKNAERACFWYSMADNHHVCKLFCTAHQGDEDFQDTCKNCSLAQTGMRNTCPKQAK